ncbi:MAG: GH116 family glycosyl-hydrolase [Candidatus Latescibacterota bacterium]
MSTLFPTDLPGREWVQFPARGFTQPVCGMVYRCQDQVPNGMPLGGIDTGCLDLETSGLLGYCTLFNTFTPRRGPLNAPLLGLAVGGRTWVLCRDAPQQAVGEYQHLAGGTYRRWQGDGWGTFAEPLKPGLAELQLEDVGTAGQIHYWGHYPVADLEFETDAPVAVGMRAWSPFLPGSLLPSMIPGIVFQIHVRNPGSRSRKGTLALSFPGPDPQEAGSDRFVRQEICVPGFTGVLVRGPLAACALGVLGERPPGRMRTGGELGGEGRAWSRVARSLPEAGENEAGLAVAVDFALAPGEEQVVPLALTWCSPTWNAGGYNWAGAPHTFVHMYARHYPDPVATAELLAREGADLLRRILAWQQVVYAEANLPVWLRESLVNVLHLLTEDGLWAQKQPPLPDWVRAEDGLFGMNECPRGCPQTECLPNTYYGNQPLVYFFPDLALSTLRGYKGYQFPDGAPTWSFGGCTTGTPPADFANPARGYQFATNGISLAGMVDRYYLCHPEPGFVEEFYPVLRKLMTWTLGLRTTPSYSPGERVIAVPSPDREDPAREWFEADYPGWYGLASHAGGLHLAQLRITQRFAREAGDDAFAWECAGWLEAGAQAMEERLWTGSYFLNCLDPESGQCCDLVFAYQLDGVSILAQHGLPAALPLGHVHQTLHTIWRCCLPLSEHGVVNYARSDGRPRDPARPGTWDYGAYSCFPAQAMMLAMTYLYAGHRATGLEIARRTLHNLICRQGCTWEQPNRTRGAEDTGEPDAEKGWVDYFQIMNLWSLPAALARQDFGAPARRGGLVARIIAAAGA